MSESSLGRIETSTHFWDAVVGIAADDPLVTDAALALLIFDSEKDATEELPDVVSAEEDLCGLVAQYVELKYGLPEAFLDEVLNRAEANLRTAEFAEETV